MSADGSPGAALSDADIENFYSEALDADCAEVNIYKFARLCVAADRRLTAEQPVGKFWCESCDGTGKIDERLTAYSDSNPAAECPDCDGNGWWQSARAPVTAEQGGALAALLQELREATDLEGFGCACEPNVQCGACKARSVMFKLVTPLVNKYAALTQPQAEPAASDCFDNGCNGCENCIDEDESTKPLADALTLTRWNLKNGEYNGADIMRAWLAIDELLRLRATPTAPTEPT